jgi:hypothetical protein
MAECAAEEVTWADAEARARGAYDAASRALTGTAGRARVLMVLL